MWYRRKIGDWIFVLNHCVLINFVLEKGKIGQIYNFGGNQIKKYYCSKR